MECDRATMFPFFAPPSPASSPGAGANTNDSKSEMDRARVEKPQIADSLRDHVIKQSEKLGKRERELCTVIALCCQVILRNGRYTVVAAKNPTNVLFLSVVSCSTQSLHPFTLSLFLYLGRRAEVSVPS